MNINRINLSQSFGSTYLSSDKKRPVNEIPEALNKYFTVKGITSNKPIAQIRENMQLDEAIFLRQDGKDIFIGKDREADEFIFRQISEIDEGAKYVEDTPETKFEGDIFDFSEI